MAIIDRIKFDSPSADVIVWKFRTGAQSSGDQIRLGSQLIVNESQEAIFVKGGQALDVFGPGTHTLTTANLPLLSRLINLPFGGQTPFAAEVWFVNRTVVRDRKWGTRQPIAVIDAVYNFPISVRAFGSWGVRIQDSRSFVTQIVGTLPDTNAERVEEYFVGEIVQRLSANLAKLFSEERLSVFQANSKLDELARRTHEEIASEFARFGIEVVNFNVENVSIPEEEKKRFQDVLGRRMEIEQISGAQVGQAYVTMRTFDTLEKAADNPGGGAGTLLAGGFGVGLGVGAGVPVGQQIAGAMQTGSQLGRQDAVTRLSKLNEMRKAGLITESDYDTKKKEILGEL